MTPRYFALAMLALLMLLAWRYLLAPLAGWLLGVAVMKLCERESVKRAQRAKESRE